MNKEFYEMKKELVSRYYEENDKQFIDKVKFEELLNSLFNCFDNPTTPEAYLSAGIISAYHAGKLDGLQERDKELRRIYEQAEI